MSNNHLSSRLSMRLTSSRTPSRMSMRVGERDRPITHNSSRERLFSRARVRNKFVGWLKFDRVAGFTQLGAILFFMVGFGTRYWATGDDGNVHAGLFKTCRGELCYDTHVFYDKYMEKGQIMASAVMEIFALVGMIFVTFFIVLYLFGLYDEKVVGRSAAFTAYGTGLIGFIGIIMFGSSLSALSLSVGWSLGLAIMGLIINIVAGIFINIGSEQWMEKRLPLRLPTIHPPRDPGLASKHRPMDPALLSRPVPREPCVASQPPKDSTLSSRHSNFKR